MNRRIARAIVLVVQTASAQTPLPAGATRVSFGVAQRTTNSAGTETCRIPQPLPAPVRFESGVMEITYAVELQPNVAKSASAQLVAPGQGMLNAVPCNVFTLVPRGFSQTQIGNTVSRADKKPLAPGVYNVRVTIDGQTADVPFTVR